MYLGTKVRNSYFQILTFLILYKMEQALVTTHSEPSSEDDSSFRPTKLYKFAPSDSSDIEGQSESDSSITGCSSSKPASCSFSLTFKPVSTLPTLHTPAKAEPLKNCGCENNCYEAVELLEKAVDFKDMKTKFIGETLTETKNNLLTYLRLQDEILHTNLQGFYYKGHEYCVKVFSNLTGVSVYILEKVIDYFIRGIEKFSHASSNMPKHSTNKINAMAWFKAFCGLYCQSSPDEKLVVCPSFLTVTILFKMYQEENSIESEQLAYSTFCEMIRKDFGPRRKSKDLPWVRFSKHSSHSKCDTCADLHKFKLTCRSQRDIDLCRALSYKHKERLGTQRKCISNLRHLSQTLPDQFFSIFIDGMDNMKSNLPRFQEKTKKLANFFKLPSKVTGAIVYSSHYPSNRKVKMIVNFDQFEQGSNMIVSILYRLLIETQQDLGKLPAVLHLSLDNCWRENKNRFVLSFLASLVQLDILSEINLTFLLVGHTGNEVDQLFSMLAESFKTEMRTLEDLIERISNSGISPTPDVEVLDFIWDWKMFVIDKLTKEELRNHSHYHAFNIKKDGGFVRLRGKRYLFDEQWVPYTGIRLLKEDTEFLQVDPAELRIEKLNLEKVFQNLQRFFVTLPLVERMKVQGSWENLREKLEKLPSQMTSFDRMELSKLKKQLPDIPTVLPQHFAHLSQDEEIPDLEGEVFPEQVDEADFQEDNKEGIDVLIYTRTKHNRPWVGRILERLSDTRFKIQWYERKKRNRNVFHASWNSDGSPYSEYLDVEMVLLWNFSTRVDDSSFYVNDFFLAKFKEEYCKYDANL